MPIYEYRCESCETEFEKLLRAGQDEPENCPECDAPSIKRLISNTNFKLKGSGWYETDYARSNDPDEQSEVADSSDSEEGDED